MKSSKATLQQMNQWIDEHQDELIQDIQAFSRIRSVSRADLGVVRAPFGPEMREMLDYALMRAASYGFDVLNHEGYCGSVVMGDLNNAIGILGHLDVVPEGEGWIHPPFGGTRAGEFVIGRGVSDNKGACVMGLQLMRMFRELGIPLRHGLRLVLGCAEETGMADMEYFVKTQVCPVVSLVPDMRFPVNYAQKGMLNASLSIGKGDGGLLTFGGGEAANMVPPSASALIACNYDQAVAALKAAGVKDIEAQQTLEGALLIATGAAAHAAHPERGASAIHLLASAIGRAGLVGGTSLDAVRAIERLSSDDSGAHAGIACEDPETGRTTMVVGTALTREAKVTLSVDCRLSLNQDLEALEKDFPAWAAKQGFSVDALKIGKPFYMPVDDPRVAALMDVYKELTGDDAPAFTACGGTYSRCLPCAITFGPDFQGPQPRPEGLPETHGGAHAPDEYAHIPSIVKAMKIYAAAILELDVG